MTEDRANPVLDPRSGEGARSLAGREIPAIETVSKRRLEEHEMYRLESLRGRRGTKKIRAPGADFVATAASAEHSNCAHSAGGGT